MPATAKPVTAAHIALLAPVPLVHLRDGETKAELEGKVAYGSRAWETFRELDRLRKGMPVDVYIYASHMDGTPDFEVSWHARYIGHITSDLGRHPDGMKYRPDSTAQHPSDNDGYRALFWEVEDLHELPEKERRSLAEFTGFGKKKAYGHAFPPEGPPADRAPLRPMTPARTGEDISADAIQICKS